MRYLFNANIFARLALCKFVTFVLLTLFIQTVSAQPGCDKDRDGVLACDVSVSLVERDDSNDTMSWQPTSEERRFIKSNLQEFAAIWCQITLGKSRIRDFVVFPGSHSRADINLYNNRGYSSSRAGAFMVEHPSVIAYYQDFFHEGRPNPGLKFNLAREFSQAALKVGYEYADPQVQSPRDCDTAYKDDDFLVTIMNNPLVDTNPANHALALRFSTSEDYPDNSPPQTAHHRCYGESAWDVLLQPVECDRTLSLKPWADLPRRDYFAVNSGFCHSDPPTVSDLQNVEDNAAVQRCLEKTTSTNDFSIYFLSGSENLFWVIDHTMDQQSKTMVQESVNRTMNLLSSDVDIRNLLSQADQPATYTRKIAMIDFTGNAASELKDVKQDRDELNEALQDITTARSSNDGSIDIALNSVKAILPADPNSADEDHERNTVIIISDTDTQPSTEIQTFFKAKHIPVHTIKMGGTANPGMKKLSAETGGQHYRVSSPAESELLDSAIESNLQYFIQQLLNGRFVSLENKTVTLTQSIPDNTPAILVDLMPLLDDYTLTSYYLESPSGSIINPSNVDQKDTTSYDTAFYSDLGDSQNPYSRYLDIGYFISNPAKGQWTTYINGSGKFTYQSFTVGPTPVNIGINAGPTLTPQATEEDTITYPEPFLIRAHVHKSLPILHATVKAEITTPNKTADPIELSLSDNGEAPDSRRNDGIYSVALKDYSKYGDGIYTIKVTASNADGRVVIDDSDIVISATTQTRVPLVPPFERTRHHQVEVQGTGMQSDSHADNPQQIEADGSISWGVIKATGQENWYRFDTDSGGIYYIQTGNLQSHGATEMATDISLYGLKSPQADPSFITRSVGHRGTNVSHIEQPLDAGSYLVSVGHVGDDKGIYSLTVNKENDLLSAHEVNQVANSGSGGGGGGATDYLLLVLLLIVLGLGSFSHNANIIARLALCKLVAFVLLALFIQTVSAQSKCAKGDGSVLECDLSVALTEYTAYNRSLGSWQANAAQRSAIRSSLREFAANWCQITLGESRIRNVVVYSDGYLKTDIYLYNNRGRSSARVGAFGREHPSIIAYYQDFLNKDQPNSRLGMDLTRGFAHAVFKIGYEYANPQALTAHDCFDIRRTDDFLATIMNNPLIDTNPANQKIGLRFSHFLDYPLGSPPQTAQYRCYGESAWVILRQPTECDKTIPLTPRTSFPRRDYFAFDSDFRCNPDVPRLSTLNNPKEAAAVQSCIEKAVSITDLNINFSSGPENVYVAIDSAMDQQSKTMVQESVNRTMDLLNSDVDIQNLLSQADQPAIYTRKIALVDFTGSDAPELKDVKQDRDGLNEALRDITTTRSSNDGSIDKALNSVKAILPADPNSADEDHERSTVIIISDTDTQPSTEIQAFFNAKHIPVHTIKMGETANPGMKNLSAETGAHHYRVSSPAESELLDSAIKSNLQYTIWEPLTIRSVSPENETLAISESIKDGTQAIEMILLPTGGTLTSYYLKSPSGSIINSSNVDQYDAISYNAGEDSLHPYYTISNPEKGQWIVYINGNGGFVYESRIAILDLIYMGINAGPTLTSQAIDEDTITYPEPFLIRAHVHKSLPILHATVKAEITTPNKTADPIELSLSDNGEAPDSRRNDGIYSVALKDYSEYGDGIYTIKVTASNADGRVVIDDGDIVISGTTQTRIPLVPPFERTRHHQVEVQGTGMQSDSHADNPQQIEADGSISWGVIKATGQENWYRFDTDSGGVYYIQTGNLQSHGATDMATDISLYGLKSPQADPSFITRSVGHRGTNVSHIEQPLDAGSYLVSVGHVDDDKGIYSLTVNKEYSLLSSHEVNQVANSGSGSSGGGGATDYLLLVLLLLIVFYTNPRITKMFGNIVS